MITSFCSTSEWLVVHFQNCSQPASFLPSQRAPITSWVGSQPNPSSPETSETSGAPSSTSTSLVIKNGRLRYVGLICEQWGGGPMVLFIQHTLHKWIFTIRFLLLHWGILFTQSFDLCSPALGIELGSNFWFKVDSFIESRSCPWITHFHTCFTPLLCDKPSLPFQSTEE